jgi:hypothetical protein
MPRLKRADPLARRQILAALVVFSQRGYVSTTLDVRRISP